MAEQPTSTRLQHGGYALRSRFDLVQHRYAGGPGYIEVLEIKNPPPGKHPIVLCHYGCVWDKAKSDWAYDVYHFWEFQTVEAATKAMDIVTGDPHLGPERLERIKLIEGFRHASDISAERPWFYAQANEPVQLFGDFVA